MKKIFRASSGRVLVMSVIINAALFIALSSVTSCSSDQDDQNVSVKNDSRAVRALLQIYFNEKENMAITHNEVNEAINLFKNEDPWGDDYIVAHLEGGDYLFVSRGSDHVLGTADDVVIFLKIS